MKTKHSMKKLSIKKLTVSNLDLTSQKNIKGGTSLICSTAPTCPNCGPLDTRAFRCSEVICE